MPERINKVIELLASGQPVYYTGPSSRGYEGGQQDAQTWADYINYDFEHSPFDMTVLREYMRGLVDGGPTKSGHRTPAVVVTLPVTGTSEATVRANAWQIAHVLSAGVHGILLCHAEDPAAVRAFVESARWAFQTIGVGEGQLGVGRMGNGGQGYAARIWGLEPRAYMHKADPWPLNPEGELFLGLKIENKRALANTEESLAVPGIAFAEWGPGDMGLSLGFVDRHDPPYPPEMQAARARVLAGCKANNVAFLNQTRPPDVVDMIAEGVRIGSGGREAAEIGRRHTGRTMPW
jgi:4-hydroxy-2-oxoheptanedioate aldolase